MWYLIIITIVLLALSVGGIAIKMFVKKDGEFRKHCTGIEFEDGEKVRCFCNSEKHEDCQYYAQHHPEEYAKREAEKE